MQYSSIAIQQSSSLSSTVKCSPIRRISHLQPHCAILYYILSSVKWFSHTLRTKCMWIHYSIRISSEFKSCLSITSGSSFYISHHCLTPVPHACASRMCLTQVPHACASRLCLLSEHCICASRLVFHNLASFNIILIGSCLLSFDYIINHSELLYDFTIYYYVIS